jgi:hypothetical protein
LATVEGALVVGLRVGIVLGLGSAVDVEGENVLGDGVGPTVTGEEL